MNMQKVAESLPCPYCKKTGGVTASSLGPKWLMSCDCGRRWFKEITRAATESHDPNPACGETARCWYGKGHAQNHSWEAAPLAILPPRKPFVTLDDTEDDE